jgi:DNA-binding CsgD family transcriptional regulator
MDIALRQSTRPVTYSSDRRAAVLLPHTNGTTALDRPWADCEDLPEAFFAGAVEALEMLGLAAAVLRGGRELICSNGHFRSYERKVFRLRGGHLELIDSESGRALARAASALNKRLAQPQIASFPVRISCGGAGLAAYLRTIEHGGAAQSMLLVLVPRSRIEPPDEPLIQCALGLTSAEARIAKMLAEGEPLDDIASRLRISRETVRSHLRAVYQKTGISKQANLVSEVIGLGLTRCCESVE